MSLVIDVDSHLEPDADWLASYPELAGRLPALSPGALNLKVLCGDLLESIPQSRRPSLADLTPLAPQTIRPEGQEGGMATAGLVGAASLEDRLRWMDRQGIDIQNVICLAGVSYLALIEDGGLRREVAWACNDWLANTCADGHGRLLPITVLDYSDLDWAITEMERMRRRGSRIVLVPGAPVNGMSVVHPSWDRFWQAVTDNGMVAMLHTGFERMQFDPGWANMGADATLLRQFGGSFRYITPILLINAMVLSGLFERHPALTLLVAELGVGWLPFLMKEIDACTLPSAPFYAGEWKYPLKPSEYMARNVRATPLAGPGDTPLADIMRALPEDMLVFSSDFPHFEGLEEPTLHYEEVFRTLGQRRKQLFMGGAMEALYERMGDPLRRPRVLAGCGGREG